MSKNEFKRSVTLAYGDSALGSLVIGGENSESFSLESWDIDTSTYGHLSVSADFVVMARNQADMTTNIAALKSLRHHSGNMGICGGENVLITAALDITTSSQTITFTATSGTPFTTDHVGRSICVRGVGSYQITGRTSSTVVTCELDSNLTVPATTTGNTARIGHAIKLTRDEGAIEGYYARSTISQTDDPDNNRLRQRYSWGCTFEVPADDTTNDSGRRNANVSISRDGSNRRMAKFTGVFTSLSTGDLTKDTALTVFEANVETWIATVLVTVGGTWEPHPRADRVFSFDDETATLSFSIAKLEVFFPDSASTTNVAYLRGADVSITRKSNWTIGIPGKVVPSFVEITYRCNVDQSSKTWDVLKTEWVNTIKPHLLSSAKTEFGSDITVVSENVGIDVSGNQIIASMTGFMNASGSTLLEYRKLNSYSLSMNRDFRHKWDGKDHSYQSFSPGVTIMGIVTVEKAVIGSVRSAPNFIGTTGGFSISGNEFGGNEFGIFGIPSRSSPLGGSGNLSIAPSSNSPSGSQTDTGALQQPGTPPFPKNMVGRHTWNMISSNISEEPEYWGVDEDGKSRKITVVRTTSVTGWLWGTINEDDFISNPTKDDDAR